MRLFPSILICVSAASAATIDFTFKGITTQASYNSGPLVTIDLSIDLQVDTANLVKGRGWFESDRYLNLKGFFSSKALGLSKSDR